MSAPSLSLSIRVAADAPAAHAQPATAHAVTFDPTAEQRTWIHGRLYRGGLYTVWAAAGKAVRWASRPVMAVWGRPPLRLPAFWDLKGTYTGARALCRMNAEFTGPNDFLFPAPRGFSLPDDPEESEHFCRPLLNAQQAAKDEADAALFARVEQEEGASELTGVTADAAPATDCGRRAWRLLNQLERRVHALEDREATRRLNLEGRRAEDHREEQANTDDEPTAHVRGAASP